MAVDLLAADARERTATTQLKIMLHGGELASLLGVPRITAARFEFHVPGGRIDLLLFHGDGSMTIVETKPQGTAMQIAAGIGQLCMYATVLPDVLSQHQQPSVIRRILCAPIEPENCVDLISACEMAAVKFVPLPTLEVVRSLVMKVASHEPASV